MLLSTLAAQTLWRLLYYGYPLPNTYYAKVSAALPERLGHAAMELGRLSLYQGLLPHLLVVALAALILAHAWGWRQVTHVPYELIRCSAALAFWMYVGGDHLGERFLSYFGLS